MNILLDASYEEINKVCDSIDVSITNEQVKLIESATRGQSKNRLWQRFRSGRITASKMRAVCHTSQSHPSHSLIMSICYPFDVRSEATEWGCKHEKDALALFTDRISKCHQNVYIKSCGLFLSPEHPYIGASPDAIMTCDCCGISPVEIKCPFCIKSSVLADAADDRRLCLIKDSKTGELRLDENHNYYYQVQTQLGVCSLESGFFAVWTEKDHFT